MSVFEDLLLEFIAAHYRDAEHSIFSPSGSHMWATCPGSLIPNLLARDQAGADAAEGTVAHAMGERWLKTGEPPDELVGTVETITEGDQIFDIEITKLMLDYVEEYVDWCLYLPGEKFVEQRVDFSRLMPIPMQRGTADHFACAPGILTITDLKYGKGVHVSAAVDTDDPRSLVKKNGRMVLNGNPQAMLYALGVFFQYDDDYDFQDIVIRIAQPRLDNMDVWHTNRRELLRFAKWIKARALDAWQLNAPLSPSDKACRFCKVKASCPAFLKLAEDITDDAFSSLYKITPDELEEPLDDLRVGLFDPKLRTPDMLTTTDMARLIDFRGAFERWFGAMETELEGRALNGEHIEAHKLVESRTNREFVNERKATARLARAGIHWTKLYSTKFASPSQAEDMLRETGMKKVDAVEFLAPIVRKPPGKPVLVKESDKRPAFTHTDEGVFDDL